MADARLRVVIEAVDRASAEFKGLMGTLQQHSRQLRLAGVAMTGMGFGIAAALGMAAQAAAKEESNIKGLSVALRNAGINYDSVKDSLERMFLANQKATKFADDEQRTALQRLIEITGSYDRALALFNLTMDLATAKNMDLGAAAEIVGRVAEGNVTILTRYGIQLEEGATAIEALAALTEKFGGQATEGLSAAEQATIRFKNALSDLQELVGAQILPAIAPLVEQAARFVESLNELDPALVRFATQASAVAAAIMLLVGPILLALSFVGRFIAGWKVLLVIFGVILSPIALVIAAILALIAGLAMFIIYWDDFKRMLREEIWAPIVVTWQTAFEAIRMAFWTAWDFIVTTAHSGINGLIAGFENLANRAIDAANFIMAAFNRIQVSIPDWVPGIGGKSFGVNLTPFPNITLPRLAEGGIVTRPTLAMIGERGPEAVVPLNRAGVTIIFNAPVYGMDDFRRKVSQSIKDTWNSGGFTEMNLGRT